MTATPSDPAATVDAPQGAVLVASDELSRLSALPLEERAAALGETVRRLEAELEATEARAGRA